MATAFHPPSGPSALGPGSNLRMGGAYPRGLPISELDFKDNRYPAALTTPMTANNRRASTMMQPAPSDNSPWPSDAPAADDGRAQPRSYSDPTAAPAQQQEDWRAREGGADLDRGIGSLTREEMEYDERQAQQPPSRSDTALSYVLPTGARRVAERYGLEDEQQHITGPWDEVQPQDTQSQQPTQQQQQPAHQTQNPSDAPPASENPSPLLPSTPRHPMLPAAGVGAGPSTNSTYGPIVPLSASPVYEPVRGMAIPISSNPRASAQYPTYITPAASPSPVNPIYQPPAQRGEEICVECAMRDQDMEDVDVTSPGVWERESDALYEDLKQREREEEASGTLTSESHSSRPRAKGGRLTEPNLKLWQSMNPREPASRHQTLETYIRSQRMLLEAEALAHARAMHESRQIDNKMRDAYSQLRRSAYDMGNSAAPTDDTGGVRIKTPRTASSPAALSGVPHARSHSREITLLENGMIVEHVDVRKEEKEERERKRKEEKRERNRARKSSRASGIDVTSVYSTQSLTPLTDNGAGHRNSARYNTQPLARPTSLLSASMDRPQSIPRAYSQASFSDVHSIGSASPRRSRFFGFKNLSQGWRSQDSFAQSGMSGSMVDMHVALQREAYQNGRSPMTGTSLRDSQVWSPMELERAESRPDEKEKPRKKKNGLAKIWRIVTGTKGAHSHGSSPDAREKAEDDLPLAPPPPLSYLVARRPGDVGPTSRHASTPSLPSITSPKNFSSSPGQSPGFSPPTAPSSVLPSPTSSRPSGTDRELASDGRKLSAYMDADQEHLDPLTEEGMRLSSPRNLQSVISEPDMRTRLSQSATGSTLGVPRTKSSSRPASTILSREKSLPPLPGEPAKLRPPMAQPEQRPRTLFTYDPVQMPVRDASLDLQPPRAPFRGADARRQSFGGMTTKPNLGARTMPVNGYAQDQYRLPGGRYDEFGISRRSLGPLENGQESQRLAASSPTTNRRKSKFGLASLFSRKSRMYDSPAGNGSREFGMPRSSGSDGADDMMTNGYATSASRHSVAPRGSATSRKALHDLVDQDPDFVAYRYPSNDQQLDLLR
ncbi:hypothetical protein PLICRDRAFT_154861 [Plicaturopsis crispa FD-325 SS-3]|nr:hypothetical protein PLICRDRAFT_154861 [Plicaturopsis crispa FD-325 SS-3]